jgi:hypothetical protein
MVGKTRVEMVGGIDTLTIHFVNKLVRRKKGCAVVTLAERLFLYVGSILGLGGCAVGWAGFGIPLPLIQRGGQYFFQLNIQKKGPQQSKQLIVTASDNNSVGPLIP